MPLPEQDFDTADITIHFDGFEKKKHDNISVPSSREWVVDGQDYVLRYFNNSGEFLQFRFCDNGRRVRISQSWPYWEDSLFALMNPAMAASIALQGIPVLHGSSLVRHGNSTLIMGVSEAGKSTLSAALISEGYMALHSDDIGVLESSSKTLVIAPGYPRLKIEKAIASHLNIDNEKLLQVTDSVSDETEKWVDARELSGGFYAEYAPLSALCVLSKRAGSLTKPKIEKVSGMQAVLALTEHLYGREWLNPPGGDTLSVCNQLSQSVPVYKVTMPNDLSVLPSAARDLIDFLDAEGI